VLRTPSLEKEIGFMTTTFDTMFPREHPPRWNMLFAEESDKDLEFDEGFEEDELNQSKPPSRRPLLWILLLLLVGAVAYWMFNDPSSQRQNPVTIDSAERINQALSSDTQSNIPSPTFREDQTVVLAEEKGTSMMMGDATNTKSGPMVRAGEPLTILDGSYQLQGWVYLVRTQSGKTGWLPGEKLKTQS
jgi:hypothetical protein